MAESFYKFQDTKTSPSRDFKDFEEEWLQLGEDLSIVFESGNSPKDPDHTTKKESNKRKISETEDSLIITRTKMLKRDNNRFTQQTSEEDPILKKFRQENPENFRALEKRTGCTFTLDSSEASPGFSGALHGIDSLPSPDPTITPCQVTFAHSTVSSGCAQVVPTYSPASPGSSGYVSVPQEHFLPSAGCDQVVPTYSPVSPGLSGYVSVPQEHFLPSPDHTLTSRQVTSAHSIASSGCAHVVPTYSPTSPGSSGYVSVPQEHFLPPPYSETNEEAQYPLQKEVRALSELVDSLRIDLLQTSMLVKYVQDYIKKMEVKKTSQ